MSIFPIGKNSSMSRQVALAIEEIAKSGLDYQITSMGTLIEGEWDEVLRVVKKAHDKMIKVSDRVYITMAVDSRTGKKSRLAGKVQAIEKILGKKLKK